jgi:hypothetical protein
MTEHKIADPGPLGLAAFAMTTFCLSSANAGLWHGGGTGAAVALALFYGGLVQLLAGMWEFIRKNTFGAVALSSYGAFWLSFWAIVKFGTAVSSTSVAIFLLGWTIFTAYMCVAALKTSPHLAVVFVLLTVTFVALTIGNWGAGHASVVKFGGWTGLATAVAAWYASAANVINDTWGRKVLP